MTAELDRFRRTLEDGVTGDLEGYVDDIAKSIVATVWNSCDDERGRLLEENKGLWATVQRARDLAAYWDTVDGGQQVAEAITSVLDGTSRPLPTSTEWAWQTEAVSRG